MAFFSEFNKKIVGTIQKFAGSFKIQNILPENSKEQLQQLKKQKLTNNFTKAYTPSINSVFSEIERDYEHVKNLPLISSSDINLLNTLRGNYGNITVDICAYAKAMNITKESLRNYIYSKAFTGKHSDLQQSYCPIQIQLRNYVRSKTSTSIDNVFNFTDQDFYEHFLLESLIFFDPTKVLVEYSTKYAPEVTSAKNSNILDQLVKVNLASVFRLPIEEFSSENFISKLNTALHNKLDFMKDRGINPSFVNWDLDSFISSLQTVLDLVKKSHITDVSSVTSKLDSFFKKYQYRFDTDNLSMFVDTLRNVAETGQDNSYLHLNKTEAQLATIQIGILEYFYNAFMAFFGSFQIDNDAYNIFNSVKAELSTKDLSNSSGNNLSSDKNNDDQESQEEKADRLMYENIYGNVNSANYDADTSGKGNSQETLYKSILLALDAARPTTKDQNIDNIYNTLLNRVTKLNYDYNHPYATSQEAALAMQDKNEAETLAGSKDIIKFFPPNEEVEAMTNRALQKYAQEIKATQNERKRARSLLAAFKGKKATLVSNEKATSTGATKKYVDYYIKPLQTKIVEYQNKLDDTNREINELLKAIFFKNFNSLVNDYSLVNSQIQHATVSTSSTISTDQLDALVARRKELGDRITQIRDELATISKSSTILSTYLDTNYPAAKVVQDMFVKVSTLYEKRVKYEKLLKDALQAMSSFAAQTNSVESVNLYIKQYTAYIQLLDEDIEKACNNYINDVIADVSVQLHKKEDALRYYCKSTNIPSNKSDLLLKMFSSKYNVLHYSLDVSNTVFNSKRHFANTDSASKEKSILNESFNSLINYNLEYFLNQYNYILSLPDDERNIRINDPDIHNFLLEQKNIKYNPESDKFEVNKDFLYSYFGKAKPSYIQDVLKNVASLGLKDNTLSEESINGRLVAMVDSSFRGVTVKLDLLIALCYLSRIAQSFYGINKKDKPKNPWLVNGFKEKFHVDPAKINYSKANPIEATDGVLLYLQRINELLKAVPHDDFSDFRNLVSIWFRELQDKSTVQSVEDVKQIAESAEKVEQELSQRIHKVNKLNHQIEYLYNALKNKNLSKEELSKYLEESQSVLKQRDNLVNQASTTKENINALNSDYKQVKTKQQQLENTPKQMYDFTEEGYTHPSLNNNLRPSKDKRVVTKSDERTRKEENNKYFGLFSLDSDTLNTSALRLLLSKIGSITYLLLNSKHDDEQLKDKIKNSITSEGNILPDSVISTLVKLRPILQQKFKTSQNVSDAVDYLKQGILSNQNNTSQSTNPLISNDTLRMLLPTLIETPINNAFDREDLKEKLQSLVSYSGAPLLSDDILEFLVNNKTKIDNKFNLSHNISDNISDLSAYIEQSIRPLYEGDSQTVNSAVINAIYDLLPSITDLLVSGYSNDQLRQEFLSPDKYYLPKSIVDLLLDYRTDLLSQYSHYESKDQMTSYLRTKLSELFNGNEEALSTIEKKNPKLYKELKNRQSPTDEYTHAKESYDKSVQDYNSTLQQRKDLYKKYNEVYSALAEKVSNLNQKLYDIKSLLRSNSYSPDKIQYIEEKVLPQLENKRKVLTDEIKDLEKQKKKLNSPEQKDIRDLATKILKYLDILKGTDTARSRTLDFSDKFNKQKIKDKDHTYSNLNVEKYKGGTYIYNDHVGKWQLVDIKDGKLVRTYQIFRDSFPTASKPTQEVSSTQPTGTQAEQSKDEGSATIDNVKSNYIRPGAWMHLTAENKTNPFLGQVPGLGGELTDTTKTYTSTDNIERENEQKKLETPSDIKSNTPNLSLTPTNRQESVKDFGKFLKSLNLQNPEDKAIFKKILHESSIVDDNSKVRNLPKFIQDLSHPNEKFSDAMRQYNRSEGENLEHAYFQAPVTDLVNVIKQYPDIASRLEEFKNKEEATK